MVYAFISFRSADADEILSLKSKSVNFSVNIFTTLFAGKRYSLSLSIMNSIIGSPNMPFTWLIYQDMKILLFMLKILLGKLQIYLKEQQRKL